MSEMIQVKTENGLKRRMGLKHEAGSRSEGLVLRAERDVSKQGFRLLQSCLDHFKAGERWRERVRAHVAVIQVLRKVRTSVLCRFTRFVGMYDVEVYSAMISYKFSFPW